ncbi:unnamed protein product [Trichogramma brassicae]|uniref:C2H2-type domain-containing protein n=1 Tax=Trichogramma brassicae TaxID=86971 RepID=A0A6H5I0D7_9HYME|nr:unnamed protein product [Trichogramma brassicae]
MPAAVQRAHRLPLLPRARDKRPILISIEPRYLSCRLPSRAGRCSSSAASSNKWKPPLHSPTSPPTGRCFGRNRINTSLAPTNIMLMVVETNGVSAKDSSDTIENLPSPMNAEDNQVQEDMTLWKDEPVNAKAPDSFMPAKPKGKAKFIGTSKEEREMALILIEKIRKKGNPTGNNLQCRICDPPRSFTAPTTLVSHYRSHAGIKPYECRICKAVFTRRHSLKYHMLIHQNQTRFTCADCGKKFRHPSHFREHRRRHTGEAPFGCEDCGQRCMPCHR